jgi:hypothetical protein
MKNSLSPARSASIIATFGLFLAPGILCAQGWRLVGITGQQSDSELDAQNAFVHPDNTLYEISLTNGSLKKLFRPTWIPDSHSIGYNPVDGMLYHTGGSAAYRDDPLRTGHEQGGEDIPGLAFQDNYYMEKINLATQAMTAVLNANPCPNPDPNLPCFGLPASRPAWALPTERRNSTQTETSFRQKGENEYSALRGMAWSSAENLFYVTDNEGIFKLTPDGVSTFLSRPAYPTDGKNDQAKGIAFFTEMLVGHKDGSGTNGYLMSINPATGDVLREVPLTYPPNGGDPVDSFGGLLGLAQHPLTGVIYGIRKTSDNFARELVTIDHATGVTALVGNMGMHMAGIAFVPSGVAASPWRLVGITGQQGNTDENPQGAFLYPDNTLFEINLANGALTKLFRPTWIPDSHAIGYNPLDGMLYHTGGSAAYRDDPLRTGHEQGGPDIPGLAFQDNYYMEKINLVTQAMTAVLNANPCPNPDPSLPCFGLPAPRPAWALPTERRNSTQTEGSFRQRGENEYSALRGMAWSSTEKLFYVTDNEGIFKLTPDGVSTFLSRPGFPIDSKNDEAKGIAFVTQLLVGHKDGSGTNGYLMSINPATGEVLHEVPLTYPPNGGDPIDSFGGLLGLAQHPATGVLYGIRKTSDNFARELVTIDPSTGATTLVGTMGMHMASIAFVPAPATPPAAAFKIQSVGQVGNNLSFTWTGGTPPYQVQTSNTLADGSWTNVGAPTSGTSTTVAVSGSSGYFQVVGSQ